jgi:hypothetical protein
MRKVSDGDKRSEHFDQLGLFNDITDPAFSVDPAGRITPEQARAILKEHGLEVSLEQATAILCYLRRWATISLPQILKK